MKQLDYKDYLIIHEALYQLNFIDRNLFSYDELEDMTDEELEDRIQSLQQHFSYLSNRQKYKEEN